MKITIVIVMFLLLGAFFIISQNNLALKNTENIDNFVSMYARWMTRIFDNGNSAVGYVVKMDWLPNQTISSSD